MACGIVVVDKPAGWTSQDVAAKLRGVFHERRVGHGGTLDPMATGVLPVFVGRATRAAEYFEAAEKEYVAGLRLGVVTNTQDVTGEISATRPADVDRPRLEAALLRFTGSQMQVPPMYSAVKIGGQRLYQLARAGREVARPPRPIVIHRLELMDRDAAGDWLLRVRCSKGTYIRTLCHDIGQALGCGGCMASLRRTAAGRFGIGESVPMPVLASDAVPERFLLPVDTLFAELPACTLSEAQRRTCLNGAPVPARGTPLGRCRVYGPDGAFLMVGDWQGNRILTEKNFFEV